MLPPQSSPYLPPTSEITFPPPTSIRSKWITVFGALFSIPFLVLGLTGVILEWSDRMSTEKSEFIYGMLLALSLLSTIFGVISIARFAGKSLDSPWGSVFGRLGFDSFVSALPYALAVLSSRIERIGSFEGMGKTLFVNGILVLGFSLFVAGFLFVYFSILYLLIRWRLKKLYRKSEGIHPR